MNLISLAAFAVLGLVGTAGAVVGGLYLTDTPVDATVIDKGCRLGLGAGSQVTVRTQWPVPGIEHTVQQVDDRACQLMQDGNYVRHFLRSERTILFETEGGECLWDTHRNLQNCGKGA